MSETTRMRNGGALKAAAYHEAGHAVVAWRRFVRLKSVTIVPGKDFQGQCRHAKIIRGKNADLDSSPRTQIRIQTKAMISLAGPIAQKLYKPRSFHRYHASSDYGTVADWALRENGSTEAANAWVRWLEVCTRNILG